MAQSHNQAHVAPELVVSVEIFGSRDYFDEHFGFLLGVGFHFLIYDDKENKTENSAQVGK